MKRVVSILVLFFVGHLQAYEDAERIQSALQRIERTPENNPTFDQIKGLAILSGIDFEGAEYDEVRRKAWERLQRVPDFAAQFDTHLREEREKWVSGRQSAAGYNRERDYLFHAMRSLPDPAVVRVVGEFLSDTSRPGYDDGDEAGRIAHSVIPSNAVLSAEVLGQLIEKPPIAKHWDDYKEEDAKTWELWYAQVKAGTRSFRFKGDPQEYNLDGPVSAGVKPTGTEVRRDDAGSSAESPAAKSAKSFPMVALIAACGILAVAILLAVRRSGRKLA